MVKPFSQAGNDLSQRFTKMAAAIEKGNRVTLNAALRVAKAEHVKVINDDSGDGRMSGVGRNGAKVGARYDVAKGTGADVSGKVSKTGPVHLLANPTKAHAIPRQRARGRRRVLAIPGIGVRASANHPGTKGKDTWGRGRRAAEPKVAREVSNRTTNILRRSM